MILNFLDKLKAKNLDCKNVVVRVPDAVLVEASAPEFVLNKLQVSGLLNTIPPTSLVMAKRVDDHTAYRIMWRKDNQPFSKWYMNELELEEVAHIPFPEFIDGVHIH